MHIEPGIVSDAKLLLSYGTALTALGLTARVGLGHLRQQGLASLLTRSAIASLLVFCFFEVLPHQAVGVSEVHLIFGTSLLLVLGAAPAAIGLALGLLTQGLFFAPADLPQYGMNLTTLLLPLLAVHVLARALIPAHTAYVDVTYAQALRLSLTYQGGIVAWVAFWAFYGQGLEAGTLHAVGTFGLAYLSVVLVEPLLDLAVLAIAKWLDRDHRLLVDARLYHRARG